MSVVMCLRNYFFAISKYQKSKKLAKLVKIEEKSSGPLNNQMKFNEIFSRYVTYDDIKSHKKSGFHPLSRKHNFGKTVRGGSN